MIRNVTLIEYIFVEQKTVFVSAYPANNFSGVGYTEAATPPISDGE